MEQKYIDGRNKELELLNQLYLYAESTRWVDEFMSLVLELLLQMFNTDIGALYLYKNKKYLSKVESDKFDIDMTMLQNSEVGTFKLIKDKVYAIYFENKDILIFCALSFHKKPTNVDRCWLKLIIERSAGISRYKIAETERANLYVMLEEKVRHRTAKLEHYRNFIKLIADISMRFISLPTEKSNCEIEQALKEIAEFNNMDSSFIFLLKGDYLFTSAYRWKKKYVPSVKDIDFSMSSSVLQDIKDMHGFILTKNTGKNNLIKKKLVERFLAETVIVIPMIYNNAVCGIICFSSAEPKILTGEDILLLETASRIFVNILRRMEIDKELKLSYSKIRELSIRVLNAHEEERRRLAGELHDEIGQALTVAILELQRKNRKNPSLQLDKSIGILKDTMQNIRYQITSLRSPFALNLNLVDVAKDMAQEFKRRTGLKIAVKHNGIKKYSKEVETVAYRFIQESITNTMRHAKADNVLIELNHTKNCLLIKVKDDGVGFDTKTIGNSTKHIGLIGTKERIEMLGGNVEFVSAPGWGTEIKVSIPTGDE